LIVLICTLPVTFAKPVIVVLPAASVVATLAKPVDVMPVELAMKLEPTVSEAELTLVLTFAKPVIVVLPPAIVVPTFRPDLTRKLFGVAIWFPIPQILFYCIYNFKLFICGYFLN